MRELGYFIYKESEDDYGVLRQTADKTKGLEWRGQENYDKIGSLMYEYI